MKESQQSGSLQSITNTFLHSAREGDFTTASDLITRVKVEGDLDAIGKLLEKAQGGDSLAIEFFRESLAATDPLIHSSLVGEAKRGNNVAFNFLYQHYWPPIYTHISLMVGDSNSAEELAQETFLKAWKGLPKTNEETSRKYKAWLFQIANRIACDYFRQPRPLTQPLELAGTGRGDEYVKGPEDMVCEIELVKEALSQIKPCYRNALILETFKNGTQAEKAKSLNISEGTFSGYVHRGREELENAYRRLERVLDVQEEGGSIS